MMQAAVQALVGPATAVGGAARPLSAHWQIALQAALRLDQTSQQHDSPAALLLAAAHRITRPPQEQTLHDEDGEEQAARVLTVPQLEDRWIEVECLQLLLRQTLLQPGATDHLASPAISSPITATVREYTMAMYMCLQSAYRPLHATVIGHLAVGLDQPIVADCLLRLVEEFLVAHTTAESPPSASTSSTASTSSACLPASVHLRQASDAVLQLAALALNRQLSGATSASEPAQRLFESAILPLFARHAANGAIMYSKTPNLFQSLPSLLSKNVLPLYFAPANPLHAHNLASMFRMIHALDLATLLSCQLTLLPTLFAFVGDYFAPLVALCGSAEMVDSTTFFNSILLFAQLGLASGESVLIKQSLAMLLQRATHLYSGEDGQADTDAKRALTNSGEHSRGNRHQKARAVTAALAEATAASDAAAASSRRVPRQTTYPDYALSTWRLYGNLFEVFLNNYELHLVKHNFHQNLESIIREHERWYGHQSQTSEASLSGSFTPDIFLELLFRYALSHSNPYVRKYVYHTLLVTLRDRVRWSIELLFVPASESSTNGNTNGSNSEPATPCILGIVSSSAYLSLLPPKTALVAFWQSQFDLLRTSAERRHFLLRFLRTLTDQQQDSKANMYLGLHLSFLAHVRTTTAEDLYLPTEELLGALYPLARSIPILTHSATSFDALAWIFLRFSRLGRADDSIIATGSAEELREVGRVLTVVVPHTMQQRSHPFHQQLAQLCNAGEWLSRSLVHLVREYLSVPYGRAPSSPSSIHAEARHLASLYALLPAEHAQTRSLATAAVVALSEAMSGPAHEPLQRALELMLALMNQVATERAVGGAVTSPASHFHQAMAALSPTSTPSSQPSTTGIAPCHLDQLMLGYFASGESSPLFSLLLAQISVRELEPPHSSPYLRGLFFALLTRLVQLYPTHPTRRQSLRDVVQVCVSQLLPSQGATSVALSPLVECKLLHTLNAVVQACHSGADSFHLAELLSPSQFLELLALLSNSALPVRLAQKSLYSTGGPHSAEELKANYMLNAQVTRWSLMRTLLQWTLQASQRELPASLLTPPSPHGPPVSYAGLLFIQTPAFFQSTLLAPILDALDGSMLDYWPIMIDCITVCTALQQHFAQQVDQLLAAPDAAQSQLAAAHHQLLLQWLPSKSVALAELPSLLERVWRSFQDVVGGKLGDECDQQVWLDWCALPSLPYATPPRTAGAEDHAIPAIFESLVDLFLHRSFFTPSHLGGNGQAAHAVLKQHLALLIPFAQRRGYRTLLYAVSLRCIELFASQPRLATLYLSEISNLLMLDRRLESGGGGPADDRLEQAPASVPMEHLIRVLFLSLFEHLTTVANTLDHEHAVASDSRADDAYFFVSHALHHLIQLNFHHADCRMDQCGGEASAAAEDEDATPADASLSSPAATNQSSVHRALTAVWHALCTMSVLRLKTAHCAHLNNEWSGAAAIPEEATLAESVPAVPAAKKKLKYKEQKSKPALGANSTAAASFSLSQPLPFDYPLLHFSHHHAFILLISPSLTSSLRHLVEIFLINHIVTNLTARPTLLQQTLLPYLDRTIYRQNIVCSFLVIAGFLCNKLVQMDWQAQQQQQDASSFAPLIEVLFSRIHIWTQSPFGQIRTVAQFWFFNLFIERYHRHLFTLEGRSALPKGMVVQCGLTATAPAQSSIRIEDEALPLTVLSAEARSDLLFNVVYYPLFLFLYRSTPIAGLRVRQDAFFRAFQPFRRSTVEGLIQYAHAYENIEAASDVDADDALDHTTSAAPTVMLRVGVDLPTEDLLLHVRAAASAFLDALRDEREFDYFSDRAHSEPASGSLTWQPSPSQAQPSSTAAAAPQGVSLNFQQKIAPSKALLLEAGAAVANAESASLSATVDPSAVSATPRLPAGKHMIMCASLVLNGVNLGGLCRTAEIMSCSLVVEHERILRDPAFTNISVSSSKWADVSVVARESLGEWLVAMKAHGYTIVGLEQTVHSTPLQETVFPDRVVLVLGNEKRGIPIDILNLLDTVIIIPQFGLIRSLNVHVSGGMVVWEYVKQCLQGPTQTTSNA